MASPMDLSVTFCEDKEKLLRTVEYAMKLGYNTICVNYIVEELKLKTSKKNKGQPQPVPLKPPEDILIDEKVVESLANKYRTTGPGEFRQISRITVTIENHDQINRLQRDEVIKKYDVLAVRPTTESLFKAACQDLNVDVIALNLTEREAFKFKRANVGQAVERGVYFEVEYTPLIREQVARRNTITNATALIRVCKGKNVILSSGSQQPMEIRGPYDVANLGLLFGMKEEQAKAAVSCNCRNVLLHAKGRKACNFTVAITRVENLPTSEQDKLNGKTHTNAESAKGSREKEETVKRPNPNSNCSGDSKQIEPVAKKQKLAAS